MPFNLHIPLPGPISYNKRLGSNRKPGEHGPIWWMLVGVWLVPLVWMLVGLWKLTTLTCRLTLTLCRAGVLYWARRQAPVQTTTGRHSR